MTFACFRKDRGREVKVIQTLLDVGTSVASTWKRLCWAVTMIWPAVDCVAELLGSFPLPLSRGILTGGLMGCLGGLAMIMVESNALVVTVTGGVHFSISHLVYLFCAQAPFRFSWNSCITFTQRMSHCLRIQSSSIANYELRCSPLDSGRQCPF